MGPHLVPGVRPLVKPRHDLLAQPDPCQGVVRAGRCVRGSAGIGEELANAGKSFDPAVPCLVPTPLR